MRDSLLLLEDYYWCFWSRSLVGIGEGRVFVILSVGVDRLVLRDVIHGKDLLQVLVMGAEVLHHV